MIKFSRFNSISSNSIKADFHIHTSQTDGESTPLELIKRAEKIGLEEIAFTEHIREASSYFKNFHKEISKLRKNTILKVLIGVETKAMNDRGDLDISQNNFQDAEIILGSVHRIYRKGCWIDLKQLERAEAFQVEFEHAMAMVESGQIDVLAHPGGMSYKYFSEFPEKFLKQIIRAIAKTSIAFEISSKYIAPREQDNVYSLCKEYNPFISIGSDVHTLSELGNSMNMLAQRL